jgi:CHASE3 domain sensor protein
MRRLPLLPSALVAATLIVLLGFLGIVRQNVAQMRSLRDETGRVEHTLQVQRALDAVLLQASEADNAARGFLLVGGDTAFNEYRQARDQLKEQLAQFQELTRDRADQQTIAALQGALAARLSALDRVIAIRRVSGVDEAMAAARAADTVRWRIESRAVASELEREEAKLLDSRRAQADIAYRRAVNGRIGSGIVSALLLVGVVALAMAHARSREKRESALIASEKRALEAATREQDARSEAERANQLKDEFLAVLSHELRTPLNAVLGWAQILQAAGPQEPTLVRALASIKRNAEAQQHLVEDLLDVSRIVTGKFSNEARDRRIPVSRRGGGRGDRARSGREGCQAVGGAQRRGGRERRRRPPSAGGVEYSVQRAEVHAR